MTRDDRILAEMGEVLGDPEDARALHALLGAADAPPGAPATEALAAFRRHLSVPRALLPALVLACLAWATAGPLGREGLAALERGLWVAMVGVSLGLSAAAVRSPRAVLVGAVVAALLPAASPPLQGATDPLHCAGFELLAATLPLAFAAAGAWRSRAGAAWHLAAVAACGAAAGDAALAVLCHGHATRLELLVSHGGGVWAAALLGAVIGLPLARRDTVRAARTLEGLKGEDAAPPLVLWALATEARSANPNGRMAALLHAAKIDRMIKGLAQGDVWDEFLQLALKITRTRENPHPRPSPQGRGVTH